MKLRLFKRKQKEVSKRALINAATMGRLSSDFAGLFSTPDDVLRDSLSRVRARARELSYNNDLIRNFLALTQRNVVGKHGIQLQVRAVRSGNKKDGYKYDDKDNETIETAWRDWSRMGSCTMDKRMSWRDVQKQVVKAVPRDGEIFVRLIRGPSARNKYGLSLQLIEADHIDETFNKKLPNGNIIKMGVEVDAWDAPVAYHVLTKHPHDFSQSGRRETIRVLAKDMLHLYEPESASSTRGISAMTSAMMRAQMLGAYEEAEVTAARIGACHGGFFLSADGESYTGDAEDAQGMPEMHMEPGLFQTLPANMDFKEYSPSHPNNAYGAFMKAAMKSLSAGLGVSFNALTHDLEGVNFSSLRKGDLWDQDHWQDIQQWLIEHLMTPVFEAWLEIALLNGSLGLPATKFQKFNKPIWYPRGWKWVDPVKEIRSKIDAIGAGLSSAHQAAAEMGVDVEEIYAELAAEQKLRDKLKITASYDPDERGQDEPDEE